MQTERQFKRKLKEDDDLNLYGYNTTTHRLRDGSIGKMNKMTDRRREITMIRREIIMHAVIK